MSFEFSIGARYLRAKQKQAFISIITLLSIAGVTVGVMALIVVIAVMAGFESDLKNRILGVESHVIITRHDGSMKDYQKVIHRAEAVEGVQSASPYVYEQIMLRSSSGVSGAVLKGIDPTFHKKVDRNFDVSLLDEKPGSNRGVIPGIVLGKELARNLGIVEGDTVYLISPRGMLSPIGHVPSMKRFRLVGVFEAGMYEYDGSLAYIGITNAQRILHMGNAVSGIELQVNNIYHAGRIGRQIASDLGFPFWVRDWMQMNKNLFSALKLEKTVMFIILALIVLVAAFNIASTLIMMVMEKTKDIAILKAMGATGKAIRRIFIFNGMVIGTIGTLLGVILGFVICTLLEKYKFIELPGDVYYITTLPVQLETLDVFLIAAAALLICFVSTLYPAHQASKLNPVEAIRYG
jgi:lipoprotein-releasing system permease protein